MARALVDNASFITRGLAKPLDARLIHGTEVIGFGRTPGPSSKHMVELDLQSIYDSSSSISCRASVVDTITGDLPDGKISDV